MRRSCVSARVALRSASASVHADSALARFLATWSSACFWAVISCAVPTRRRIFPERSRTGNPVVPQFEIRFRQSSQYARPTEYNCCRNPALQPHFKAGSVPDFLCELVLLPGSESPLFFTTVAMPVQSSYGGLRSERNNRASHKDCKNNPQWFVASLIVLCWVSRHCVSCKARACWVSARAYQPSVQFPQDSKRGHSNQPP
jgi:hypothetical protein